MALVRRTPDPGRTSATAKLVAVVGSALPAATPVQETFAAAYQRVYPRACAFAARVLGADAGPDVVHDVFAEFLERWTELTPEQRADPVILVAIRNRVIDVLRHDALAVELTPDLEESGRVPSLPPVEPGTVPWLDEVVDRLVEQLSPRCREAYRLVRYEDFSYEEAARAMNLGTGSVKSHLVRANALIREALTGAGYRVEEGRVVKALPRSSEGTGRGSHD